MHEWRLLQGRAAVGRQPPGVVEFRQRQMRGPRRLHGNTGIEITLRLAPQFLFRAKAPERQQQRAVARIGLQPFFGALDAPHGRLREDIQSILGSVSQNPGAPTAGELLRIKEMQAELAKMKADWEAFLKSIGK